MFPGDMLYCAALCASTMMAAAARVALVSRGFRVPVRVFGGRPSAPPLRLLSSDVTAFLDVEKQLGQVGVDSGVCLFLVALRVFHCPQLRCLSFSTGFPGVHTLHSVYMHACVCVCVCVCACA